MNDLRVTTYYLDGLCLLNELRVASYFDGTSLDFLFAYELLDFTTLFIE